MSKKILISGYYGFDNVGDEAILKALIKNIKKDMNNPKIKVLSAKSNSDNNLNEIESVDRKNIISLIKEVYKTDVLISGGGSLLQDVTSRLSIYYYLFVMFLGILFSKDVILYSQGIGPINNKFNRWLTKVILNKVTYITVREKYSKRDLIDFGVKSESIDVTADLVMAMDISWLKNKMFNPQKFYSQYGSFDNSKETIILNIRSKEYKTEQQLESLVQLICQLRKTYNVVLLPFHFEEDIKVMNLLKTKCDFILINKQVSIEEMIQMINDAALLIGERLHSLIFASVVNTPMVGISYDLKIDYFLETLSLKAVCSVQDFSVESILNEVELIMDQYEERIELLKVQVDQLKAKIELNNKVMQLIDGE